MASSTQVPLLLANIMTYVEIPAVDIQASKVSPRLLPLMQYSLSNSPRISTPLSSPHGSRPLRPHLILLGVMKAHLVCPSSPTIYVSYFKNQSQWEIGLSGSIIQADPGYQNEIEKIIEFAGESLTAHLCTYVDSVDEVCSFASLESITMQEGFG
jgi:hypothetical protein